MSELSAFLDALAAADRNDWYTKQVALASFLLAGLLRRFGRGPSGQVPDPHEIVNETILRIKEAKNPKYIWDGINPATLNRFFGRCMRTTIASLRSKERAHVTGISRITVAGAESLTIGTVNDIDPRLSGDRVSHRLDILLQGRRLRGKNLEYLKNIENYAKSQSSQREIAEHLGVEFSTVDTFRKRAAVLFGKRVDQGQDE